MRALARKQRIRLAIALVVFAAALATLAGAALACQQDESTGPEADGPPTEEVAPQVEEPTKAPPTEGAIQLTAQPTDQSATAAGPVLTCVGRKLPIMAPGVEGVAVTCQVDGADGAQRFSLSATLVGRSGASWVVDPLCEAEVQDGGGSCTRNVIEPVLFWGGTFTIGGTLQPGGEPLSPVEVQLQPAQ